MRRVFAQQISISIWGWGIRISESHRRDSHCSSTSLPGLKHHEPAHSARRFVNSQPMGSTRRRNLVPDARAHGIEVRPVDVAVAIGIARWAPDDGRRIAVGFAGGQAFIAGRCFPAARGARRRRLPWTAPICDAQPSIVAISRRCRGRCARGPAGHRHRAVWQVTGVERALPLLPAATAAQEGMPLLRAPREGPGDRRRLLQHGLDAAPSSVGAVA